MPAQADRVDPEAVGLRAVIGVQMERAVRVAVHVAIEARDTQARLIALAVLGLVELLLREGVSSSRMPSICTGVRMP